MQKYFQKGLAKKEQEKGTGYFFLPFFP